MEERPSDERLKSTVNEMLFTILPPTATLAEVEEMAVHIYHMLCKSWDKHERALLAAREGGAA
jgi:hypothetical protein